MYIVNMEIYLFLPQTLASEMFHSEKIINVNSTTCCRLGRNLHAERVKRSQELLLAVTWPFHSSKCHLHF